MSDNFNIKQQETVQATATSDLLPAEQDLQCNICHEPYHTNENEEYPIALPVSPNLPHACSDHHANIEIPV